MDCQKNYLNIHINQFIIIFYLTLGRASTGATDEDKRIKRADELEEIQSLGLVPSIKAGIVSIYNAQQVQNALAIISRYDALADRAVLPSPLFLEYRWLRATGTHLNCRFRYYPSRTTKRRHVFIYSEQPNKGKSTFLRQLEDNFRCSRWNSSESFQNQILDDTQLLLIDQFGGITWKQIEEMCDGDFFYPRKGGDPLRLRDVTLVCCSNQSPTDLYGERTDPRTNRIYPTRVPHFLERFRVLDVTGYPVSPMLSFANYN